MAASLPDNLWIGILIMAVIILALLWNDRISRSSGGSRGGGGSSSNDGPSVSMRRPRRTTVGEEFELRGSYDAGDGSISGYSLTINGRDITDRISTFSGGTFAADSIEVPDVDTVECDIQVSATYGTADDSISFNPTRPSEPDGPDLEVDVETEDADPGEDNGAVTITADPVPGDNPIQETVVELPDFGASDSSTGNSTASLRQTGISPGEGYRYVAQTTDGETPPVDKTGTFRIRGHHEGNLEVEASHEVVDPDNGEARIWAEVVSAPAEIEGTSIKVRPIGGEEDDWRGDSTESNRTEIAKEFLPGTYEYEGVAATMDRRDTDRGTFQIGEDGEGSRDDYPELVRIINQNTNNNLGDLGGFQGDEDVTSMLEQILEQVDSSGSDGETARIGMDAYQLLLALNTLNVDLDGDDNQQILAELRQIRQQMGGGGMSSDELENALRAVLQDVFGQDLQGVIEGLDFGDGFDEDAIVDAIENKDMDLSEVTDRLDNIEQAVAQIQSQGGDLGDVEQKLDDIESAVRDLQVDDQIFQNLTAEIRSLRNQGVQVNVDMDNPLMIKLAEDIQRSGDPQAERQRILRRIRQEGAITRRLLIQLTGNDPDSRQKYYGENWGVFLDIIGKSDIDSNLKDAIIDVFRGEWNYYPVSARWVVRVKKHVENMDDDKVPEAAEGVVKYTKRGAYDQPNDHYLQGVLNLLRSNYTPEDNFLIMRKNSSNMAIGHEPSYSQGEIHDFLKKTYQTLQQQHERAEKISELDEQAIQDMNEAMEDFEKERAIIQALSDIPHDEWEKALKEGDNRKINSLIDEAEKRAEIPNALGDEKYLQSLLNHLQEIEDDIQEAHDLLKRADEIMNDEVNHDMELEDAMETFEASYMDQLRGAMQVLETYNKY